MTYRGKLHPDERSRLADWAYQSFDFPKHSADYDEISRYLETAIPFPDALTVFDELWEVYTDS
jgi:uncharacterized protein YozE (UPF0346 family)